MIYHDDGASKGNRTRLFRDCDGGVGVEWMFAVDHASGYTRWYGFSPAGQGTIQSLLAGGMDLKPWQDPAAEAEDLEP